MARSAGRLLVDAEFLSELREKYALPPPQRAVVANLELGIERLTADRAAPRDVKIRSLRYSIHLLDVVASLHSPQPYGAPRCSSPRTRRPTPSAPRPPPPARAPTPGSAAPGTSAARSPSSLGRRLLRSISASSLTPSPTGDAPSPAGTPSPTVPPMVHGL